jgi:tetratricopeptide (TPR) repeat protein
MTQPLGDLEPRLLNIVLGELRRDLLQREQRNRTLYHNDYSYYWGEHAADYLRTAEEVYAQQSHSGRSVKYIADYLWHGLDNRERPIEMLFVALRDEILDESGQQQLVTYLFNTDRHAEAVPILEQLVEERPDNMSYRTQLMVAYHRSRRPAQLQTLLARTDEHFRQQGRWTEGAISSLAHTCVECALYEEAVGYYGEVIPLHQRTQPNQGIAGGTLSEYYRQLALAHSNLGQTAEAVDAAAGAIIAWGPDHEWRSEALDTLARVMRDADDLDEYVASLDAKADATGEDSPVLRKAIGLLYRERENFAEAARNLELALELQSGDPEIYQGLIACYDALERNADAVEMLLAQIDLNSHDLSLYEQLLNRFADDPEQAERAATSIVEASPLEAENHQQLAGIRAKQQRFDDAVAQWRRVADLRSLEPNGLLGLAAAQLDAGDPAAARETLRELGATEWPSRFEEEVRVGRQNLNARIEAAER